MASRPHRWRFLARLTVAVVVVALSTALVVARRDLNEQRSLVRARTGELEQARTTENQLRDELAATHSELDRTRTRLTAADRAAEERDKHCRDFTDALARYDRVNREVAEQLWNVVQAVVDAMDYPTQADVTRISTILDDLTENLRPRRDITGAEAAELARDCVGHSVSYDKRFGLGSSTPNAGGNSGTT